MFCIERGPQCTGEPVTSFHKDPEVTDGDYWGAHRPHKATHSSCWYFQHSEEASNTIVND
jgi:hypothetical protein